MSAIRDEQTSPQRRMFVLHEMPVCATWFDMRDLGQAAKHVHDASDIEVIEGPGRPPRDGPH
jgi:hypothetical protein